MLNPGLQNKTVLITGANSGIGKSLVQSFAEQQAHVLIHYWGFNKASTDAAQSLAFEIYSNGGKAHAIEANLANPINITRLWHEVDTLTDSVDILINNAATYEAFDTIETITAETLATIFAVNTYAPVLMIKEYVQRFQRKTSLNGAIINISSNNAQHFFPYQIAYGASKAALESFTRSIAIELGHLAITVNAIAPGPVHTGTPSWISSELEEKLNLTIPLGRCGEPEDIASAALFLASQQARWITGQIIKVDGGHGGYKQ